MYQSKSQKITSWLLASDFHLWLIAFLYTAVAAAAVQLIILPFFLPHLHWGEGLLVGNDSISFHLWAKEKSRLIDAQGWGEWELWPWGQGNVGILSVFYHLFLAKPWIMIPVHAFLQATALLVLSHILSVIDPSAGLKRIWAVIPFLLFPSSAAWYAQLHKDGYFILGNLLFIYGWMLWMQYSNQGTLIFSRRLFFIPVFIYAGFGLAWFIRPYWGLFLFLFSIGFLVFLLILFIFQRIKKKIVWKKGVYFLAITVIMVAGIGLWVINTPTETISYETPGRPEQRVLLKEIPWDYSHWLPHFIDERLRQLALVRKGFISFYLEAGTNIDTEILFHNARGVISYIPRAVYIGFCMPTSKYWFGDGFEAAGSLMRRVSFLEMSLLYLSYPFLFIGVWLWRNKPEVWILLAWGVGGIILFTLVTPNIGTLYRFRLGFIGTFLTLGLFTCGLHFNCLIPWQKKGGKKEKDFYRTPDPPVD